MEKVFKTTKKLNVFEWWQKTVVAMHKIHNDKLLQKQQAAKQWQEWNQALWAKLTTANNQPKPFESKLFVALIKYLIATNDFFYERLGKNQIDELLLLAFLYEWICLKQAKDLSLLGSQNQVLTKLLVVANKNSSITTDFLNERTIDQFNTNQPNSLANNLQQIVQLFYQAMVSYIKDDQKIFNQVLKKQVQPELPTNDLNFFISKWNELFILQKKGLNYVYSINDSSQQTIFISMEDNQKQHGFLQFSIFPIYGLNNEQLVVKDYGKQILAFQIYNPKLAYLLPDFLTYGHQLANRVIKKLFLLDLELQNHYASQTAALEKAAIVNKLN